MEEKQFQSEKQLETAESHLEQFEDPDYGLSDEERAKRVSFRASCKELMLTGLGTCAAVEARFATRAVVVFALSDFVSGPVCWSSRSLTRLRCICLMCVRMQDEYRQCQTGGFAEGPESFGHDVQRLIDDFLRVVFGVRARHERFAQKVAAQYFYPHHYGLVGTYRHFAVVFEFRALIATIGHLHDVHGSGA